MFVERTRPKIDGVSDPSTVVDVASQELNHAVRHSVVLVQEELQLPARNVHVGVVELVCLLQWMVGWLERAT